MADPSGIEGLARFQANVDKLSLVLREKHLKAAVRKGGNHIRDLMEEKAPRGDTGELAGDIVVSVKNSNAFEGIVEIGPSTKTYWYAKWQEFGTKVHTITASEGKVLIGLGGRILGKSVTHPGQPARPFVRPALDEGRDEANRIIGQALGDAIEREVAQMLK